jgi:hypothetical protein
VLEHAIHKKEGVRVYEWGENFTFSSNDGQIRGLCGLLVASASEARGRIKD